MKETTFVVTVNADGKYNTKMYSEEDYNSKVVPFLSEHYTPDQYSVAGLQDTTADNITEDGQYIVSVDANGATHRKTYTGKELLGGKLTTIGQQFPDYRLQYVDGAVRPAEGSDDIIAVPWQKQMGAKIAQQKDNIGKTLKEVDETVADVKGANLSELLKERGDAMTNFANMAVYNGLTKTPEELEAMHQEDLYRRDLRDINKELEDVNNQLDEWVQHEIDIEDFGGPNLQWILDNAARKDELLTKKADLIQRQTSNPYYKREDKRLNEIADNVIAKAYPALADLSVEGDIITPNNPEADVWQAARFFADKAKTTLSAPDDNANGFVSFLKGHGARFSDADFWLAGLESIASNMKVKKVFDTISSKLASYADQNIEKELTDGDLDYLLSDAEKQLLLSFVTASEAEALRAQNTNNIYQAGITSAESLAFMAQFILTGGVGDAFAAGSKRAARGLATWLAKNTGKIGTRAASMASKAGATLVGRGATAAADAVVTPFLKSIPMTLMQTGLYKDYAQKLTERDEAGNLKYDYDTAVLPALRDAGLEVWSEMALEPVLSVFGKTMGIGIDKLAGKSKVAAMFNTKLDDLATFFHNREAMEILAKAGFDGYFEEIGEEILAAGVSSLWEPEAWSQFWEKDNLVTMAVAFAPMSIIGGGMSMANYVKREMAYDEIAPSVQEMLARRGVLTDEQISELFNREVNTMQDVADKISGIINPIIASGQITAEEFKTLYDFAGATAQKDIANALVKRAEEDRRIVMRNNMDQRMNGKQYTGKDAEGNETISFYEDEKGNRRYVVVDAGNTDGLCLSMDENGKDLKIVNVNELEVTTMGANAFFDNMWKEGQAAQESQRMQDDAARQRQSVAQALKSGKPVQMYNPQTNEREDYVFLGWNGEAAVMANAKTGVEEERTIQDLANALHISDTVLTDAQREQAQIDESRKNDSIARSANDYKGAPVNFNGVSGTLLRLSSRGDENGNSSLVASIITSNGELVPVNVTADMVEDFIQERKDLAASGNAAAADRRTRDHERKEQQRKDSEAYRSSKEKYTNPDGSVREGEFLDNDPRGFAMYSDGKYGKADTDATLAAALANAQTKAQQALQAKEAEANPDVKAGLRDQYQRAVAALDTLDTLLNERHQDESSNGELAPDAAREKYQEYENLGLSDDEIYELGMKSINEIRERIAALPVPAVSTDVQSYMDQKKKYSDAVAAEQKKIDYWRSILSAPMTESEKKDVARANARMQRRVADIMAEKAATKDAGAIARLDKELKDVAEGFIGQAIADINTEGDPVVISTAATIEKDMRDAGSTERAITNVLSAIQEGYQPRGIFDPTSGVIFFIADYNTDVAEARNTFIHERQHKRTREAGLAEILIDRLGLTGRTEEEKKAVLLPELAKLIRTSFYDGKSARDIADEIISYSVEHEFNGVLDSLGLNDIITNFAKNIDNERSNAAGLSEPGRNGNVNESYRVTDQGDERAQEAESGAVAGQGSGSLEGSEAEEVIDGLTASQRAEINKNVGGEIEAGEGSAPVMFSVTAQVTGVGFDYHIGDDGSVSFVGPDGRVFDSEHHITVKDLQAVDRSAFKYLDDFCHTMGYYDDKASTRIWQKYADMLNAYLDKGAGEGGFGNLTKEWQWIADSVKKVFRAVATNSDAQYSKSLDITRVCKKNEAVINAISALQRKLGYGITPGQIMDIYYNTLEAGYQAPCPVCYVFTRYIRNGQYATIMLNGKQKYGDRLQDVSMLSVADRKKAVKFWLKEYDSQLALNEKHDKTVAAAKQDITVILDEIDKLSEEYGKADTSDERKAEIRTRIDELDAQYKSALNVVSQSSLDSWITQFAIHKVSKKNANKPGVIARKGANGKMEYWDLWEDQRPFPDEIALDLRETATAMTEFAAIQRFRNSRGAAAGKEITFAADNGVGEVALMLANEKDPRNYLQEAVDAKDEKTRRALLKTAYDKLASAHIYTQQQTLRGGQRMWSWSDNIERLAPDVFINILQLEMLGGGMQTYSKQLEGIKSVATMDAYVNGSLMGRGIGYMEVPEDMVGVKDGKYILTKPITHTNERKGEETVDAQAGDVLYEFDGKLYALVFDDVVGVQAFAKPDIEDNGKVKKGLFDLNAELDKAGNIIVGMDDLHVRMAMADDRIFFIIPWHSSGANNHILSQMYRYLGAGEVKGTDFTNVQEEKYMGESKKEDNATEAESVEVDEAKESETSGKMTPALVEFWENHRNEEDFACGLGHIDSGDGKGNLSQGQIEYKALRDVILKGYEFRTGQFDKKTGKEKTKLIPVRDAAAMGIEEAKNMYAKIQADAFLSQAEQTVYDSVDTHLMTSGDTKFIYPYEYWDKDSTMATADVNGARYLEYCRRMGYKPKFCGTLNPNAKKDYGNFADDKGYWKLLIDRRMYDRDGNYQDLVKVNTSRFSPSLVDPSKTKDEFIVTRVADEEGNESIAEKTYELEQKRPGGVAAVDYSLTLDKAVDLYETAKSDPEKYYKRINGTAASLAFRVGNNSAEDQAEIQKALDLVNGVKTFQEEDGDVRFSIRTKPAPKNTGIGYKVFYLKDGKLYPPMVANPDGADTPVGVWLDADAAPQAATSKTGRKKVKAGGKGTQGGSGTLAYRPGWHLGEIPYALQFNRGPKVDNPLGITGKNGKVIKVGKYFPANFVWAEVEYAKDVDYQDEAMSYGYNEAGNFQHSLAGLPKVPEDGSYTYRTNANPATDPWIITGAMKVNRILTDSEVDELVRQAGREPQLREGKTEEPRDIRENNEPSFRVVNNNQQVFVSNALASLDKIPMKSGNAQAWINKIQQAGGLKKEEDKWMGLTDWLKEQKGNISKEDVAEFIREHQVQIEEVKYGVFTIENYRSAIAEKMGIEFRDKFLEAFDVWPDDDNYKGFYTTVNFDNDAAELYNEYHEDKVNGDDLENEELNKIIEWSDEIVWSSISDGYELINPIRLDYTTDGLLYKREIALTVPTIDPYNEKDDIHFGDAGEGRAVAWSRFGEAVDENGNRVLVIDEIQSKRHQDGKEKGYKDDEAVARFNKAVDTQSSVVKHIIQKYNLDPWLSYKDVLNNESVSDTDKAGLKLAHEALKDAEKEYDKTGTVSDAPFRDSWDALAMKRMLRLAAEEGYDKIAWTNGSMQAERYNIGHVVDHIRYDGMIGAGENQGAKIFTLKYKDKGTDYVSGDYDQAIVNESGDIVMGQFQGNKLSDLVGKDIATEMLGMNERGSRLEGESLRIGGEGMRYFYDQKLVNWMNKYGKKWGIQVADITLPNLENKDGWHSVDVTPEMKESVMEGQPMFRTADERDKLFKDAKNEFGTTRDFREAGYLLPDGSMLDFSEKKNGGEPGRRGADHRDIARVINDRSYGTMTEYLDDFINEGAIRLIPESGAFSVAQQPTKEQKNMLRNFIYRYNGEVEVEIYKNGHSVADPYYRERTSPTRILNDIDAYFKDGIIPEGNAPMFRMVEITPETRQEMEQIEAIARVNGTYLKAPNGADTKLNPEQWSMVRTNAFKNWFGDWENDPANASKVLDENGEPMVVYHATTSEFTAFEMGHKKKPLQSYMQDTSLKIGHWFSPKREWAEGFAKRAEENFGGKGVIMEVFLNIRNPKTYTKDTRLTRDASERDDLVAKANAIRDKWKGSKLKAFNALDKCILDPDIMVNTIINNADALGIKLRNLNDSKMEELEKDLLDYGRIVWEYKIRRGYDFSILDNEEPYDQLKYDIKKGYEQFITNTKSDGFDGVLVKQTAYDPYVGKYNDQYVAFDPNQIKSATDNTGSFDPTDPDIRYRVVPGGESMAERTYRESGAFSFTGSEKISSIDDVAFIFRELQERATENSFLVLVKDGVPTILHTGIGNVSSTAIDMTAAVAGYNDFKPDMVYMVHNHPSGNLYASRADRTILDQLRGIFNGVPVEGIILDTVSGNYGVFDQWSDTEREMPESGDEFPVKVLAFDKQVFDKEFRSQMNDRKVRGAEDVAAFLSAHRLGDGDKLGVLLLNHNNIIVANYVTNDNALTGRNAEKIARQVADVAVHNGATATIMFGNFNFTDTALTKFNSAIKIAAAGEISLLDVVQMDNYGNYHSVADGTLNGRRDGVMFRVTPEMDREYMSAVNAGDMEKAQQMVDEVASSTGFNKKVFRVSSDRYERERGNNPHRWKNVPEGVYYAESLDYYENSATGYNANDARPYYINTNNFFDPMNEMKDLIVNVWSDILGRRSDFDKFGIEDEASEYRGTYRDGEEICQTSTDGLTIAARNNGFDGVILRDIPQTGSFKDFTEYAVFDSDKVKSAVPVTYDDEGRVIPLSERFNPGNDDIRFRITPERDEEYRKAYKAGDKKKAIEMLSDAFLAAYPDNKLGARLFYKGKNGEWKNRIAGYFTDDYEFASHYGNGDIKECFLVMENPYEYDFKESGSDGDFEGLDGEVRETHSVIQKADAEAKEKGLNPYDGYILRNVGEGYGPGSYVVDDYIVKDPKQVKSAEPFTFDDNGELIPLSQRFNPESNDVRFRVTPEVDEAYKDAVDAGDMKMAQALVDAAAESAMADSQVRDENGKLLHMYHGTRAAEKFYVFDTFNERSDNDLSNVGSHFGPKGTAQEFSKDNLYDVYLNLKKVWEAPFDFFADIWNNAYLEALIDLRNQCEKAEAKLIFDRIYDVYPILATYDLNEISIVDEFYNDEGLEDSAETDSNTGAFKITKAWSDHRNAMVQIMRDMMEAEGFDGISYENWYEGEQDNLCYVALYPSQIKSADAVTYDNQGNMIPLSQRFTDSDDIRFRVTPEQEDAFQKAYEAKDVEAAQAILDKAAKAAGYRYKAYHGTPDGGFTVFDNSHRFGEIYFTDNEYIANSYKNNYAGENPTVYSSYLRMPNPLRYDAKRKSYNELANEGKIESLVSKARENGNGGVIIKNIYDAPSGWSKDPANLGTDYLVLGPSDIKSADPFTFDDNGNLIPLSERFNTERDDIRFRISGENATFAEEDANELANDIANEVYRQISSQENSGNLATEVDSESDGEVLFRFIGELGADRLDKTDGGRRILDLIEAKKYYTPDSAENIKRAYGWELDKDAKGNPVWKYEENDFGIKDLNIKDGAKLSDVIDDEGLFAAYPELKNYTLAIEDLKDSSGYLNETNKKIALEKGAEKEDDRLILIHEIQHFIQDKEGWVRGANIKSQLILDTVKDIFPYIRKDLNMFLKSAVKRIFDKSYKKESIRNFRFFTDKWGFNPIEYLFQLKKANYLAYVAYLRKAGEVEARNAEKRADMTALERRRSLASETEDRPRSRQWRKTPYEDVMFRIGPAAEMKKKGMVEYLTPEQLTEFTDRALQSGFTADELSTINDRAFEMGGDYSVPVLEHFARLAEKDNLDAHDNEIVEKARQSLVSIIGAKDETFDQNDMLWVAYDAVHGDEEGIYNQIHNRKVKRALDEASSVEPDLTLADYLKKAAEAKDDLIAQFTALRELANNLTRIMDAMSARRDYDRVTVGKLVSLTDDILTSKLMDDVTNGEIKRLTSIIRRANGMRDIQSRVNELYNLILTNNLRRLKGLFEKELKKKAVKIDSNNVVNQGALDLNGQIAMTAMKENLDSFSEDQSGNIVISQTLADKIADARERTQSEDAKESERADMELLGLTFARDYIDGVVASEKEEQQLRDALKEADEALRKDEMNHLEHLQFVKEQTRALAECRTERVGKFTTLLQKMQDLSAASHELALMMNEKDKERIAQIHHDANSDMQGVPSDEHPKDATFLQRLSNNPFTQFFFRPLATFDQMLRLFGNKSVNGEGYLWNRFMRGWIDATGKEYKALQAAYEILDDKVSKVFGKKMRWSDLYSVEAKMPKATIRFWDGGIMKEHELTQGNLLYIMLADQMTDGRMKLRAMGITEEDVDAIRSQMDARFKDLADWIVNDFLPSRREAYNEVHERMFGASMSKVQNYFPLKVLSNARTQQVDVASASTDPSTPSTVTGSIMKRTRNALALDVMGTDAFSLVIEHVQKMEHWAAFAEWNRDLSDLLSYKRFRNQVQNMTSIYGSQRNLWTEFVDTAMIAAGSYKGKSGKLDPAFNRIAKGVTAAKISLRVFTAIKQFLSFPAYFSEANPVYLAAGFVKGWNWSMDNLPLFEKRWKSRQAGDHILAEGNLGKINEYLARIGMTPNALVDAYTVSIGSYAIYKTKYDKYIKMGFSPEAADKRAKQDAVILYNETQQSSEAAFMSSMQSGRSTLEKMFTVFRNSSMGYQRQVHDALRNYKHRLTPGYKKDSIEYMTKQLIREGLTEGQAMKAAKGLFARQGVKDMTRLMIFGYGLQFFWSLAPYLPYLLFGDDDDKKKEMLVDAAEKGVFGSLEGLTGGNLMSEAGNLLVFGEGLNNWDPSLLPLVSDFTNLYQEFGKDNVRAMNDLLNLGIQMGIGVNPQTLEDAVVAIIDACNGDLGTAKEAMLLGLRIINAPQTSLDQLYLDEIDMNALEAKDLTIPELAERYVKYKKAKGAGAMAPLYSLDPALDEKITAKYLSSFENKAKERLDGIESDGMYAEIAEQAKAMDTRVKDLRKLAKSGDEDAEKELMEIFLSDDFGPLIMFNELSKDVETAINNAVSAPTREEMLMYLDEAERLRSNILNDFGNRESNESWFRAKYTQYTKGFLPEMARLEKKYSEEYAKANPKYKEWMEKHQQDLDSAADKAKANAERVAEIDAELKKYEIELPNGKKRYFNQPARKKLQEEKKALREEGTTEKAYLNRLKKQEGFTPEDFMPPAIYNSPEFQTYLEFKSLGSVSGNNFRFKTISEWETKMNEAEDPETRAKYREKIDERMILLGQQITRKLNGVDDEDDGFSLDLEEDLD